MQKDGLQTAGANDLRVHWWVQYELAVRKIQRAFRRWNAARSFRRNYSRKLKVERVNESKLRSLESSFQSVVAEEGTFYDKMCLWRAAVELRRAHKAHKTDLVLRSLIDSSGDLSRAVVLLGTKDYALLNKADLPSKLRRILVPKIELVDRKNPLRTTMLSSLNKTLNLSDADNHEIAGSTMLQNNVNLIRSLRGLKGKQIVYERTREERRTELFSILNSAIERAYMSRNHAGAKDFKVKQKAPHNVTASSQAWLAAQMEEILNPTMDALIHRRVGTIGVANN